MITITPKDVTKVAHLSRIAITEDKIDEYTRNLANILELIAQINEVDTDGIEPMSHPLDFIQRLREDTITEIDQRELLQSISPETDSGLYLVPKVME